MKKNNIKGLLNKKKLVFFTVLVFAWIQFSSADNNSLNISEDWDQDGIRNEEEGIETEACPYKTDPRKKDTDGDGYSDKVECDSGWNPLDKESPGLSVKKEENSEVLEANNNPISQGGITENKKPIEEDKNLTENFLKDLTKRINPTEKAVDNEILEAMNTTSDISKYSLTEEEVQAIVKKTLAETNLNEELEVISEEELNIQEEVTEHNNKTMAEEKKAVEEYFVQVGYIMFEELPFLFQDSGDMVGIVTTLISGVGSDIDEGDTSNITNLKGKTGTIYEKIKAIKAPYVLKDVHKMGLSLQKYMISQNEDVITDKDDPVALTMMLGKAQAMMSEVDILGEETLNILDKFEIDSFDISDISNEKNSNINETLKQEAIYGL